MIMYSIDNQLLIRMRFLGWHLARLKFFVSLICAITKLQTVNYEKLSRGIGGKAKAESNLRRIQRFFADFDFDMDIIARLVFHLLPASPPYCLSMDRTNWKFGNLDFNILTLIVCYKGVGIPLMWMMLPKKGNSNTSERKLLMQRYLNLFGSQNIECLVADREFIGKHWFEWLVHERIKFHIRIRENIWIHIPGKGKVRVFWLFNFLKVNQAMYYSKIVEINSNMVYLSGLKTVSDKGISFVIVASYNRDSDALLKYKDRWQIETMFKAMKSSGYNIEDTHLTDTVRLSKLIAIISIAFIWADRTGIHVNEKVKPIRILNNGRRAKSIFKYGLEKLMHILLVVVYSTDNPEYKNIDTYVKLLSCT